jgi:deoxyribodipyrimidine photo-lyase
MKMSSQTLLIYLMRRDLRLQDNPVFHEITNRTDFTHLLPVYVFPAQQIEVSGFIPKGSGKKCPYPEARSAVGGFWRCGKHRAKFLAESVWELKQSLEEAGSGLEIRVGSVGEVIKKLLDGFASGNEKLRVGAVWMTKDETVEERREEKEVNKACREAGVEFKLFQDEKYFIDE